MWVRVCLFIRTRNRILDNKKQIPYTQTQVHTHIWNWDADELNWKADFIKHPKYGKLIKNVFTSNVCYFVDETIWIMFIFEWNLSNDDDEDYCNCLCLYMCLLILYLCIKKHGNCHTTQMEWWMLFLLENCLQESDIRILPLRKGERKRIANLRAAYIWNII